MSILKLKREADMEDVADELARAEHNIGIISNAAMEMKTRSLLFHDLNRAEMMKPLENLISDLKLWFSFIRRRIQEENPGRDFGSSPVANSKAKPPPIKAGAYQCLCPMTLFFRIIAQALNAYRITARGGDWGSISQLRSKLIEMETRISSVRDPVDGRDLYWPGLATCIMFHEHNSAFTVTSSAPRYFQLEGLASLGTTVRKNHLTRLSSDAKIRGCIETLTKCCEELRAYEADPSLPNPFAEVGDRTHVHGIGATFDPRGQYMTACFLDSWRFNMERPEPAKIAELTVVDRGLYGVGSCAEWELWVAQLSSVKPKPKAKINHRPAPKMRGTWPIPPPPGRSFPSHPASGNTEPAKSSSFNDKFLGYPTPHPTAPRPAAKRQNAHDTYMQQQPSRPPPMSQHTTARPVAPGAISRPGGYGQGHGQPPRLPAAPAPVATAGKYGSDPRANLSQPPRLGQGLGNGYAVPEKSDISQSSYSVPAPMPKKSKTKARSCCFF